MGVIFTFNVQISTYNKELKLVQMGSEGKVLRLVQDSKNLNK